MVDQARLVAGAEAVVDVDHRHAARARVQHGQKRRDPAERRPVAHARGHGDDRARHQPRHDARQGSLHARHGDDHAGLRQLVGAGEQAMDAGHAHVVAAHDVVSQELRRHRRLFGHRHVARPRRRHDDAARARRCGQAADDAEPCLGAVGERGQRRCKRRRLRLVHARHQHARLAAFRQCAADALDLGSGLPLAVHDLAHALAHAARQVGLGIAQILERRPRQPRRGLVGRQRAGLHRRKHLGQFLSVHVSSFRPCT